MVNHDGAKCKESIGIKVSFSIPGSTQSRIRFYCCCHRTTFILNKLQSRKNNDISEILSIIRGIWQSGIQTKRHLTTAGSESAPKRTDLYEKALIRLWIWPFNCTFGESSVTQRRWPQRHLVAVETSQCDCVSMSSVVCEHIWQKKKENNLWTQSAPVTSKLERMACLSCVTDNMRVCGFIRIFSLFYFFFF